MDKADKTERMEKTQGELKSFLDGEKRLHTFPAKRKRKLWALAYLAEKLEPGRVYTEKELGEELSRWHTFGDPATLRREMFDYGFLGRDPAGRGYWLEEKQPLVEEIL